GACSFICGTPIAAIAGGAPRLRYHYISLNDALPPGVAFFDAFKLTNDGFVYGNATTCDPTSCTSSIAVYRKGIITVLLPGIGYTANEPGTVGGTLRADPDQFIEQAALFDGRCVERIPRLPGELTSHVIRLTDSDIALVESTDTSFNTTHYLYRNGHV